MDLGGYKFESRITEHARGLDHRHPSGYEIDKLYAIERGDISGDAARPPAAKIMARRRR